MIRGLSSGIQISQPDPNKIETPKPQSTSESQQSGQTITVPPLNTNITGTSIALQAEQAFAGSIQQALLNDLYQQAKLSPDLNSDGTIIEPLIVPKPKPPIDAAPPEEQPPAEEPAMPEEAAPEEEAPPAEV